MAWAPPTGWTSSMPTAAAAASVTSAIRPSGPGGTHTAISPTPATMAGTVVMISVDG